MILSTTPAIEGHTIREYKGVVFGEVITGVNFLKDFAASVRNFFGGRSGSYENALVQARFSWRRPVRASVSCRSWTGRLAVRPAGIALKCMRVRSPCRTRLQT